MISGDQILAHLVGDYILQSDWMANEKTKRSAAALAHVITYAMPFLFFRPSLAALAFIALTHFVIDRWRLARYVVWAKNFVAPKALDWCDYSASHPPDHDPATNPARCGSCRRVRNLPFHACSASGYDPARPAWLATWLLIIADNTLHLICNGIALRFF